MHNRIAKAFSIIPTFFSIILLSGWLHIITKYCRLYTGLCDLGSSAMNLSNSNVMNELTKVTIASSTERKNLIDKHWFQPIAMCYISHYSGA